MRSRRYLPGLQCCYTTLHYCTHAIVGCGRGLKNMPKASRKELRKTLFKKGSDARTEAKKASKEKHKEVEAQKPPPPPQNKRYILFVGNLPYDVKEEQIKEHFKNCPIHSIRMRQNGICFLEFQGEDASQSLHHALQFHHTMLGKRKINVELSAGGGGNSTHRRNKIKQKNDDFLEEMKAKQKNQAAQPQAGAKKHFKEGKPASSEPVNKEYANTAGINPARLAALQNTK